MFGDAFRSLDSLCACGERYVLYRPLKPCDNLSVFVEMVYLASCQLGQAAALCDPKLYKADKGNGLIDIHCQTQPRSE